MDMGRFIVRSLMFTRVNCDVIFATSFESDSASNSSKDLTIEQGLNPFYPIHSSPSKSMAYLPPLDFSRSSSQESLDQPPNLHYYYDSSY